MAFLISISLFSAPSVAFASPFSYLFNLAKQQQQQRSASQGGGVSGGGAGGGGGGGGIGIGKPFGGRILVYIPCINGAAYIILGPPSPGPYVYQLGVSRSYMMGPPSHIGQFLLGMAAPGGVCTHGADVEYGSLILYTGSSLFGPTFAPSVPVKKDPLCC